MQEKDKVDASPKVELVKNGFQDEALLEKINSDKTQVKSFKY